MSESFIEIAHHLLSVVNEDTCEKVSELFALTISVVSVIRPGAFIAVIAIITRPDPFAVCTALLHLSRVSSVGTEPQLHVQAFELLFV